MNATELQRQQLIDDIQSLPANVIKEAAEFIARLRQQASEVKQAPPTEESLDDSSYSPYEDLKEFGLIGFVKEGPSDLSVNYKQALTDSLMEKYGHS
ncbi:MAG: hypothetical protein ACFB0D_12075 [Phormidesmis sp.]